MIQTCSSQNILTPPALSLAFRLSPHSLILSSGDGDLFLQWREPRAFQGNHMGLLNCGGKRSREALKSFFIHLLYQLIMWDLDVWAGFHVMLALPLPFRLLYLNPSHRATLATSCWLVPLTQIPPPSLSPPVSPPSPASLSHFLFL